MGELQEATLQMIHSELSNQFQRSISIIKTTIDLLESGNTVPFIARYRKDVTNTLDEVQLRDLQKLYTSLVNREERRISILNSIEEQGKLNEDLKEKIMQADTLAELEDLYLPFKQKRQTRAQKAREAGLEPLADIIMNEQPTEGDKVAILQEFVDPEKEINNEKEAISGASYIIIERISEDAEIRKVLREVVELDSIMKSDNIEIPSDVEEESSTSGDHGIEHSPSKRDKYSDYFEFKLQTNRVKPHQILALNRGENEGVLDINLEINDSEFIEALKRDFILAEDGLFHEELEKAIEKGYDRVSRTIKRELWVKKIIEAKTHAIKVFAENLKNLILQPPVKGRRIVGVDPGYRNGCKIAVIDENGKFLDHATVYPHPPQNKIDATKSKLLDLVHKHDAYTFAIGNGTASRETEVLVAEMAKEEPKIEYTIVNEAGASVYSASDIAREEFPDLDLNIRGAVSIARRLQDPLSELIKIDPKSIGVGLYQHDVNQTELEDELNAVVEDCVNKVGVNLNIASIELLKRVSGLNSRVAKEIVERRENEGRFKDRNELMDVKFLGEKTFEQAAGFLKIFEGSNPLDSTFIHPESYKIANQILDELGFQPDSILNKDELKKINKVLTKSTVVKKFSSICGEQTLQDIINALKAPRRDPRDDLPPVILKKDILKAEDLEIGMILKGTVRNVVDFGAFVDIGIKYDGLVHISEIANTFVKNTHDFLSVGDVIDVMVKDIDLPRKRLQLSIKAVDNRKKQND